ncbi:HAD family phosphatase [Microbacterium sp. 18062]|uniref:HAD family hydrolase n=1 Tax=Microbacterium sp. 18062 TaxID=2681410 RepID=UPI00135B7E49|nr:HAD family phosphatase [Microbacterium sp. 18062]
MTASHAVPATPLPAAAVLWDMDGTLVDTEDYWTEAAEEILREEQPRAEIGAHSHVGLSLPDVAADLRARGVRRDADMIVARLVSRVAELTEIGGLPWRPGALEMLAELCERAVPVALVTMSYRTHALAVTAALPIGRFDVIVAGDEVRNGKPAPDAYLEAARRLDVPPEACLAIEDSPVGLRAARSAGCRTLGVPCHLPLLPQHADAVWPTLFGYTCDDLLSLLPSLADRGRARR